MNTDNGQFVTDDEAQPWMKRIMIGEVVFIKGEGFLVKKIEGRRIELELMSAMERGEVHKNRHERRKAARANK